MAPLWQIVAPLLVASAAAASQGDLALWRDARAGVIRDTLYIEGGIQGQYLDPSIGAVLPLMNIGLSKFNFSTPFNKTSNFTALFLTEDITPDPNQKAHFNGFMVADNNEWYSFGGQAHGKNSNNSQYSEVIRDGIYIPNADATSAPRGVTPNYTPSNGNSTTNGSLYITNGAGVNIPDEHLGYYFSGLRSANRTDLSDDARNNATLATTLVTSMLRVNTTIYNRGRFDEIPLPDDVSPRADAVLAWIPTGAQGVVLVIGGVTYPASFNSSCTLNSTMFNISNIEGPEFVSTISAYDVATGRWYNQATSGSLPPQMAQACAVVATSDDGSIHNVHVYGGYNGVERSAAYDDVWILSVPSFTWVRGAVGNTDHGRYAHICAKPYPGQMMVVGGTNNCGGPLASNTTIADVFNMNNLTWQDGSYDPTEYDSTYVVPAVVSSAIAGKATASTMDVGLQTLFRTPYGGQESKWWPYPVATTPTPLPTPPAPSETGTPKPSRKWVIPVAVVCGVVGAGIILGAILFCWRRNRRNKKQSSSPQHKTVSSWLNGQPAHEPSVTSDGETTQVNSAWGGTHEVLGDSYFKGPHAGMAELNSDSDPNTPAGLVSPYYSARGPTSPLSQGGAELHSQSTPYELPTEVATSSGVPQSSNIRDHHMYPPSVSGHAPTVTSASQGVSSPTSGPITPYELPQNRNKENNLPVPPNDMVLGQVGAHSPRIVAASDARPKSPHLSAVAGDVSPNLSAVDDTEDRTAANVSPDQRPVTPTQNYNNHRSGHTRNTSSLSSGLPDLHSPTPSQNQRQSAAISALPDSPRMDEHQHPHGVGAGGSSNLDANMLTATTTSPISPLSQISPVSNNGNKVMKEIRRKELRNWPRQNEGIPENDDMARGTV